ncbi:hypothetical protein VTL71DRAFT_3447 [Oculimacula yallundae]|uniref:Uncharacterized protein n=1 Tax=Oculimacula yallundae TaxID=86028 RepID=A0ABR4C8C8_9HELO
MRFTPLPQLAFATVSTTPSTPYIPEEDYCDLCSASPCSCGWAEDREIRINHSFPAPNLSAWLRHTSLGLDPEHEEREEPRPPPPRPLPPKLPPLSF